MSLLKYIKKIYFENLDEKSVINNKVFRGTVNLFSQIKLWVRTKIHLTENGELITTDLQTADISNRFIPNIV